MNFRDEKIVVMKNREEDEKNRYRYFRTLTMYILNFIKISLTVTEIRNKKHSIFHLYTSQTFAVTILVKLQPNRQASSSIPFST